MTDSLQQLWGVATQTVAAFSPVTMQMFDRVCRDLSATIGVALVPVIETATSFVKNFADMLLPVTEKMGPVFAKLGSAFLDLAEGPMNLFFTILQGLTPVLEFFAEVVKRQAELLRALNPFSYLTPEKKDSAGMAAPQNAAWMSFADLGKQMALQAAKAFGEAGNQKTDSEKFDEIIRQLERLGNGEGNLPQAIGRAVKTGGASGPESPRERPTLTPYGD